MNTVNHKFPTPWAWSWMPLTDQSNEAMVSGGGGFCRFSVSVLVSLGLGKCIDNFHPRFQETPSLHWNHPSPWTIPMISRLAPRFVVAGRWPMGRSLSSAPWCICFLRLQLATGEDSGKMKTFFIFTEDGRHLQCWESCCFSLRSVGWCDRKGMTPLIANEMINLNFGYDWIRFSHPLEMILWDIKPTPRRPAVSDEGEGCGTSCRFNSSVEPSQCWTNHGPLHGPSATSASS